MTVSQEQSMVEIDLDQIETHAEAFPAAGSSFGGGN